MSARKIMLLLVAGLVAIGTVIAARSMMMTPVPEAQAPVQTTEVLVAARDLPTGTILKEADVKWLSWAADADTSKLYVKGKANPADMNGAILRDGLRNNEPVQTDRVVQPHEQGFLAAVLAPGMRAMSLTLTPGAEVAGFIFPGDRVDVILTHSFSRKDIADLTERRVSETVITNARVLALDQRYDSAANDPKVAQLATLEVTPKQAEKLALALDITGQNGGHGSISLALRSLAAVEPAATSDDTAIPLPVGTGTPSATTDIKDDSMTWDNEITPGLPSVNGDDQLLQKVQVMRGKDTSENTFIRHK